MRTVIFDLDGTLADTSGDLIAAANVCFSQMGAGAMLHPDTDAPTALRGGRAMLRLGLSRMGGIDEAEVDRWYPVLLEAYGAAIDVHTRLYPGVVEAVDLLVSGGTRVGICTNKPEGLAETLLTRLGVRDLFGSLVGADTLPVRKPDPAPFRAAVERAGGAVDASLLVGDTETDRETARAAGVPCILVRFGPEGAGVARLEPEATMGHFAELPDLAARLLGQGRAAE
ncbi:HAD-IA family hydrolase [Roseivivax isoporae]|uniref:phosphoglycolate phosphatase n=1 Tax=Roseivivax isoporae LMG 25204 TaxID=1449351 RepID=X7FBG7_9RHOB|nr:HAD-IA family hydrolase [Roseivivax isoporae]ETX29456.1 haloacid dehalogenase [Roseivivax isoporae LMG 25204]